MRVPLSWIREFAPVEAAPSAVADALNEIGLIVDAIEAPGRDIGGVVVARVLEVVDHPDADKLTLVDVDFGQGQSRVVCGARNLAPGDVVPYAPPGATLPGGLKLERRKIRGQESDGMLCSAAELGLGDDHTGILHLGPSAPLGGDVREVLGLDDVVFELDITPNRPDAMSVVGVARDLAAKLAVPFTVPVPATPAGDGTSAPAEVEVVDAVRCPRYVAMTGSVAVGESPTWLANRLTLAGLRPISNVVDVTNYVLLERGQPLHAFDQGLLGGGGIRVRVAEDGERITTLDGVERELTREDLLICDAADAPQAIAGVMGGATSEVHSATARVLLESAYFAPEGILRTSKRLGLRTESSARFERGVDPNGVLTAADRAWELLAETAGGTADGPGVDAYPEPIGPARITLRTDRVNHLLGTTLTRDEIATHLRAIELDTGVVGNDLDVAVPTFRPDLEREVDLVEEVARLHGYNRFPRSLPRPTTQVGALTPQQVARRRVCDALVGRGLSEAMTLSLVSPSDLSKAGLPAVGIEVENPLRVEESLLRTALLPGLLRSVAFNASHGLPSVSLFEVGHVFLAPTGDDLLPDEREHLAAALSGAAGAEVHGEERPVDTHDVVGVLEAIAAALDLEAFTLQPATRPGLHPARCAAVYVEDREVGAVGEVDPEVVARIELPLPVVAFELDLGWCLTATKRVRRFAEPSRYPASTIDLAFSVPADVPARAVRGTLMAAADPLAEAVELFDVFRSDALGAGQVSLAFRLRFRAPDRTLTDSEVGEIRQACIAAVERTHGATLRG
ncbi:MAG: phenylalanine--tRNA ligase subunit beta [Actinobacteria bacterium]|nr:phenylalanine--tRNA ligase subunit beta [Actinomycetota bacterium]